MTQDTAGSQEDAFTLERREHLARVLHRHTALVGQKYWAGQVEHGGQCWEKPGMLAHGLDEVADLTVYLWTAREQLLALAERCEAHDLTVWIGQEIRRIVHK